MCFHFTSFYHTHRSCLHTTPIPAYHPFFLSPRFCSAVTDALKFYHTQPLRLPTQVPFPNQFTCPQVLPEDDPIDGGNCLSISVPGVCGECAERILAEYGEGFKIEGESEGEKSGSGSGEEEVEEAEDKVSDHLLSGAVEDDKAWLEKYNEMIRKNGEGRADTPAGGSGQDTPLSGNELATSTEGNGEVTPSDGIEMVKPANGNGKLTAVTKGVKVIEGPTVVGAWWVEGTVFKAEAWLVDHDGKLNTENWTTQAREVFAYLGE